MVPAEGPICGRSLIFLTEKIMIEKPQIEDQNIITALNQNYSIQTSRVEFLPIGNDASAWAYRIDSENQNTYFLKVRKDISNPAGFLVPRFLQDHGIGQVLAPLRTREEKLWVNVEDYFLILYPFVNGKEAMQIGMTDAQWTEFGSVLKRIHNSELPPHMSPSVRQETFIPKWINSIKALNKRVHALGFDDPYQKELAAFWKENAETIQIVVERTEQIGKQLQRTELEFVLCHADIHTANILLTPDQEMFIVDWDDTLFAPKERDLMFVLSDKRSPTREEQRFFDGYGTVQVDQLALAYYRYEWCVQEIGDFGARVFLEPYAAERTKKTAVKEFMKLFSQGDVIAAALKMSLKV